MLLACGGVLIGALPAAAQEPRAGRAALPDMAAYEGLENVSLSYDAIRILGSVFVLQGDVDLVDSDHGIRLLADELRFDATTLSFEATGNVSFEQNELLLNGSAMRGDLDAGTMEMEDPIGVAPGPFYVRAERIEQLEPGKITVHKGVITPCNQTSPIWEFRSGSMTFKIGSYVNMAWPHIRVKGLPIFGLPYLHWPLSESRRQTGLLIPGIGRSNRKGFMVSESFFWATSRSTDLTFTYEHFSKAGNGFGGEFRHALAESTSGFLRGYVLPGREATDEEIAAGEISFPSGARVEGAHLQALPGGFVLRAQADVISSVEFARGFQDRVDQLLQRQSVVSMDMTKSWGASTLSLVGDHRENFINTQDSFIGRRLPQVKYTLRSTQVGGPFYVGLQSSAARFQKFQVTTNRRGEELKEGGSYTRFDALPDVSLQLTGIPWLTVQPFFQWRATWWSARESNTSDARFVDESIFRNFYETGVELVGPSIFKIIDTPGSGYSPRFKHLIQPRVTYRRVRQLDAARLKRIISFDEVDAGVLERQEIVAEVTTRLFAKRFLTPSDEQRQVWQVFEMTFGRLFDLDPLDEASEAAGIPRIQLPYFFRTIVQPTARFYLQGNVSFSPALTPANVSLSANINHSTGTFGLVWFRGARSFLDPEDITKVLVETNSHTIQANTVLDAFERSLTLGGSVAMDLLEKKVQNLTGTVSWNLQCCSIGVNVQRINFVGRQETQFAVLLELAHVGNVGFDNAR